MKKKKTINISPKKTGKVVKAGFRQIGESVYSKDVLKRAMKPGLRISKDGHKYYEYRKNRTDLKDFI
jgi:hypothetical protein